MKITKIRNRKNIRKSKKSINNQHGGMTYEYYKQYIENCKKDAFAEYYCRKRREHEESWGKNGDWEYGNCMYQFKHKCKQEYIKNHGDPPSRIRSLFGL